MKETNNLADGVMSSRMSPTSCALPQQLFKVIAQKLSRSFYGWEDETF